MRTRWRRCSADEICNIHLASSSSGRRPRPNERRGGTRSTSLDHPRVGRDKASPVMMARSVWRVVVCASQTLLPPVIQDHLTEISQRLLDERLSHVVGSTAAATRVRGRGPCSGLCVSALHRDSMPQRMAQSAPDISDMYTRSVRTLSPSSSVSLSTLSPDAAAAAAATASSFSSFLPRPRRPRLSRLPPQRRVYDERGEEHLLGGCETMSPSRSRRRTCRWVTCSPW